MKSLVCFFAAVVCMVLPLRAQWAHCGIMVSDSDRIYGYPEVCADNRGGAYVLWRNRPMFLYDTTRLDTYVARVSPDGRVLWRKTVTVRNPSRPFDQTRGRLVANDKAEVYAAWEEIIEGRYYAVPGAFVQKFDSAGNRLWGDDGVLASVYSCLGISLSLDGTGGIIIVSIGSNYDTFVTPWIQRLDGRGRRMWGDFGIALRDSARPCFTTSNTEVICDGRSGDAIIAWIEVKELGDMTDRTYAQRIDSTGRILWRRGGVPLHDTLMDVINSLALVSDCIGGAFVIWDSRESRPSSYFHLSTVQRIDSLGNRLVGDNGMLVCDCHSRNQMVGDGRGGVWIVMSVNDPRHALSKETYMLQRMTVYNTLVWSGNGLPVTDPPRHNYSTYKSLCPDGYRGVFVKLFGTLGFRVQWMDDHGNRRFGNDGIPVCDPPGWKGYDEVIANTSPGEAMLGWEEGGIIRLAKINRSGIVSVSNISDALPAALTLSDLHPNPSGSSFSVTCGVEQAMDLRIALSDESGREIAVLFDGRGEPGSFRIPVDASTLQDGVYFITARANGAFALSRMVVLKR